jgi:hypothetical protein
MGTNMPTFGNLPAIPTSLSLVHCQTNEEKIVRLIDALRTAYSNGGALFAKFTLSDKDLLRQHASHSGWQDSNLIDWFLRSPSLAQALPDLQHKVNGRTSIAFDLVNPFLMIGEVASCVFFGGAYRSASVSASDALSLSLGFCDVIFDSRFDDVRVFRTYGGWSDWFCRIAWDKTWVIFDKAEWTISLLCVTDMD